MSIEGGGQRFTIDYKVGLNLSESQILSPSFLMMENSLIRTSGNISQYLASKANGNLTVIDTCADARVAPSIFLKSSEHMLLGSIAGGTPRGDLKSIINNPAAKQIMILGHHDGDSVKENHSPSGCGGLHEKHELCSGHCQKSLETEGLHGFVDKYVRYDDVLAHSYDKARYTASLTDKPVMSATVDHLTGKIYPIAIFSKHGRQVIASIPIDKIEDNLQKFGRLTNYENGIIPTLKTEDLSDDFAQLLENNAKQVEFLFSNIDNFSESQKIQNPHTVYASSVLMPSAIRYPDTFSFPNSSFKVFIPQSIDGVRYDSHKIIPLLEQLKYPLLQAIKNRKSGTSFSAVRNIIVETSNQIASENICKFLLEDEIVKKWIEINNGEVAVMASEVTKGKTKQIKKFSL